MAKYNYERELYRSDFLKENDMQNIIQIFDLAYNKLGWFGTFCVLVIGIAATGYLTCAIIICRKELKREFGGGVYWLWELFIGAGDRVMRRICFERGDV